MAGGGLPAETEARELAGVRVLVMRNVKTGQVAPLDVIHGRKFKDYPAFMAHVNETVRRHAAEHSEQKDGWVVEDRWARDVDDFLRNHPELTPTP